MKLRRRTEFRHRSQHRLQTGPAGLWHTFVMRSRSGKSCARSGASTAGCVAIGARPSTLPVRPICGRS
jgi:hypothetical protein